MPNLATLTHGLNFCLGDSNSIDQSLFTVLVDGYTLFKLDLVSIQKTMVLF